MSISSVGADSASDLVALQKQLQDDQKTLAADQSKKDSTAVVEAAQLKVQTDEQAIAQAGNTRSVSVKSGVNGAAAGAAAAAGADGSATASGSPSTGSSVDLLA